MAGVTIKKLTDSEKRDLEIETWPIWEKEVSRFDWTYSDTEHCYIINGEFVVETSEGNFEIGPGDFVTFDKGLECVWDIKVPVKKYYNFS